MAPDEGDSMKRLIVGVAALALLFQVTGSAGACHRNRGGCAPSCGGYGGGYASGGGVQYQVSYQQQKRTVYECVPQTQVVERTVTELVPTQRQVTQQVT